MWHTHKVLIVAYVGPNLTSIYRDAPLVTFEEDARRSRPSLRESLPRHDDGRPQHSSSLMVLATGPTPSWANHMFLLPSEKHLTSSYTKSSHPNIAPSPDNRRRAGRISQPQSTTRTKYFHGSSTQHILKPPGSNTTNTSNIDHFRWAVHHVSNI